MKPRFLRKVLICLLFSRKQRQNLLYVDDSIIFRINVPDYTRTTVETTFIRKLLICLLFSRKQRQNLLYVDDNILFGFNVPDYPRRVNTFLENYSFVYFLAVNNYETKLYVLDKIIFGINVLHYPEAWKFFLKIINLFTF